MNSSASEPGMRDRADRGTSGREIGSRLLTGGRSPAERLERNQEGPYTAHLRPEHLPLSSA